MDSPLKKKFHFPAWALALLVGVWLIVACGGLLWVHQYEARPGQQGAAPGAWPADSRLWLDSRRPTLVVLAQPRCVCTRATLEELARLQARCWGKASVHVLFYRPAGGPASQGGGPLWEQAARIPGARVTWDDGGAEAARFGALTSGHALLFSPEGRLLFSGGMTAGRGMEGDNQGLTALTALLLGETAAPGATPVFGCALRADGGPAASASRRF